MQPQLGIWKRFIRSLFGVDRCSLSWGSGRGLLEVYEGWTDAGCVCNFMSMCIHIHKQHVFRTLKQTSLIHWWNFPVKGYLSTYLSTCEKVSIDLSYFFFSLHQGVYSHAYPPSTPFNVRQSCSAENLSLLNACLFYRYDKQQWIKYIWAAAGQSSTMTVSWWTMWCKCYTV